MTIRLTEAVNIAGVHQAAGSQLSLSRSVEQMLIGQRRAVDLTPSDLVLTSPIRSEGAVICDWQAASGTLSMNSANGGGESIALDQNCLINGLPAAKCTFSTAASAVYVAKFILTKPIWLGYFKSLQIPVRFTSSDSSYGVGVTATPFEVWLQTATGKIVKFKMDFTNYRPNTWRVFSANRSTAFAFSGGATAITDLDGENVTELRIVQSTVTASANAPVWIGPITSGARRQGLVSIVMDGCYDSQWNYLRPLLNQYGLRASLALTNGQIGTASYLTEAQIQQMYDEGHEPIHHTFASATKTGGYANATQWPTAADITADVQAQWAYLRSKGWTRGIGHAVWGYTYGFAASVAEARQAIVNAGLQAAGLKSMRKSVPFGTCLTPHARAGLLDPLVIDGAVQVTSTDSATTVNAIVDRAEALGEWAIITIHRAVLDAAVPGSLEMKVGEFDTVFSYIAGRVRGGGLTCLPQGEAFDRAFA